MFEPIRYASPVTLRQSGSEVFQKRYSFVNALLELEITRRFNRHLRSMMVYTILLSTLTVGKAQSGGATGTIVGTVVDP
jgi:hypothetical protein